MEFKSTNNIEILVVDTNKINFKELLNNKLINEDDIFCLEKIKNETAKKEKLVSKILIKKFVGNYYLNENGKPLSDEICFNISHSKGLVCFARSEKEIGIDVEKIREVDEKIIDRISSKDEKAYIKNEQNFFEVWTAKEAFIKMIGSAISLNLKEIPSLPLNSFHTHGEGKYLTKTYKFKDYIISICLRTDKDYIFEIKQLENI